MISLKLIDLHLPPRTLGLSTKVLNHCLSLLSILGELALWALFAVGVFGIFTFFGSGYRSFIYTGLWFSFSSGRRLVLTTPSLFSLYILPILFPAYYIFFQIKAEPFWSASDLLVLPLCLAISRAPLYFSVYTQQDFVTRQNNRLVIIATQALYGWALSIYNPSFTEYLEWAIMPSFQLGAYYENSLPQIELYYESSNEAEKISELLPKILKNIETSPFYSLNKQLKLCQKNTFNNIFDIEEYRGQGILGHYNPVKKSLMFISLMKTRISLKKIILER